MPLDVSRIQAICFDIDGTLIDTDDQWVSQVEKRLELLRPLFSAIATAYTCEYTKPYPRPVLWVAL